MRCRELDSFNVSLATLATKNKLHIGEQVNCFDKFEVARRVLRSSTVQGIVCGSRCFGGDGYLKEAEMYIVVCD